MLADDTEWHTRWCLAPPSPTCTVCKKTGSCFLRGTQECRVFLLVLTDDPQWRQIVHPDPAHTEQVGFHGARPALPVSSALRSAPFYSPFHVKQEQVVLASELSAHSGVTLPSWRAGPGQRRPSPPWASPAAARLTGGLGAAAAPAPAVPAALAASSVALAGPGPLLKQLSLWREAHSVKR